VTAGSGRQTPRPGVSGGGVALARRQRRTDGGRGAPRRRGGGAGLRSVDRNTASSIERTGASVATRPTMTTAGRSWARTAFTAMIAIVCATMVTSAAARSARSLPRWPGRDRWLGGVGQSAEAHRRRLRRQRAEALPRTSASVVSTFEASPAAASAAIASASSLPAAAARGRAGCRPLPASRLRARYSRRSADARAATIAVPVPHETTSAAGQAGQWSPPRPIASGSETATIRRRPCRRRGRGGERGGAAAGHADDARRGRDVGHGRQRGLQRRRGRPAASRAARRGADARRRHRHHGVGHALPQVDADVRCLVVRGARSLAAAPRQAGRDAPRRRCAKRWRSFATFGSITTRQ
jgi:hypothetical protein